MAILTFVGGLIAGAIGLGSATLFGMSVGSLIGGALAFGTQLGLAYLNRPKKRTYSAVQGQREYGARVPVTSLYGTGKTMGHHIFYAKYGSGNKYNADVFVLANGWCDGLEPEIYFYGQKHTLVPRTIIGNEVAHYGVDGFDNLISIRFYDGRPGQGPDTKLVADTAALGQNWKATSVCAGMAYVVVEREWSEAKFDKGQPDFEFVFRGLRLYDPRKDSTVAGGSGPQRLDDPATWQFSKNPALQRLNYQLGLRGLASGRTLIGEGKSLGQLDLGSYFAAMNACDAVRAGKPTYETSLLVTSDDDHTEVLKEFDDGMAGYGMNRRGLSGVIAGAPQLPVLGVGPDDIDMGRPKSIKHRKSAFDLYNHMSGQFISTEANWTPASLKPIVVNADVNADGRPRQIANDFLQVTDPDIAQYLLQIRYRQQRKGGSATVPVSRRAGFRVQEGEWITYAGKTWLVTNWSCDEELQVTLTLAETGPDVYSSGGIEPGPIVVPPTPPVNPSLLSTVQNFNVEIGFKSGPDGYEVPTLRFTWTPPEDPTITMVRFEYFAGTNPASATIFRDQCDDPEAGEYETSKDVVPMMLHTARATIRTVPDRLKVWTTWTTTSDPTGAFQVFPPGLITEIHDWTDERLDWLDEDSPLFPLGEDVAGLDEKVDLLQSEIADLVGAEEYNPAHTYLEGALVQFEGGLYRAIQNVPAATPPSNTAYWEKIGDYASLGDAVVALSARLDEVETEIDATADGFKATTRDSRRIYTALMSDALGEIDKAGATAFDARDQLDAAAIAARWTETEISRVDGVLTVHAADIAMVQATLGTKADVSVTQAMQATIVDQGDRLTSQGAAITSIQNALPDKADVSALNSLSGTVSAQGSQISAQGSAITSIESALNGYMGANAVATAMSQRYTKSETDSEIEDATTALAGMIEDVQSSVGNISAGGRLKAEAMASPGGGWARLGLSTSANDGVSFEEAAILLEARTSGSIRSRVALKAAQTLIIDANGNLVALFGEDGLTMENIRIGTLKFNQLESNNGKLVIRGAGNDAYIEGFS